MQYKSMGEYMDSEDDSSVKGGVKEPVILPNCSISDFMRIQRKNVRGYNKAFKTGPSRSRALSRLKDNGQSGFRIALGTEETRTPASLR